MVKTRPVSELLSVCQSVCDGQVVSDCTLFQVCEWEKNKKQSEKYLEREREWQRDRKKEIDR